MATDDLTGLIERLEKGSGPDYELDGLIHRLVEPSTTHPSPFESWRWGFTSHVIGSVTRRWQPVPDLTTSLDAALAFAEAVLPGWCEWAIDKDNTRNCFIVAIVPSEGDEAVTSAHPNRIGSPIARSAPRAILIATLRALSKDTPDD